MGDVFNMWDVLVANRGEGDMKTQVSSKKVLNLVHRFAEDSHSI
jgi:hypothetical protein